MPERVALDDQTVMKIRLRKSQGATLATVASEFNISPSTVSQIVTGKRYKHLPLIEKQEDPELVRLRKALTKIAGMGGDSAALAREVLGL